MRVWGAYCFPWQDSQGKALVEHVVRLGRMTLRTSIMIISFATLAAMHLLGLALSLYYYFPWYDLPMHFFGGVIVALGLYVLIDLQLPLTSYLTRLWQFTALVLIVAVLWEVFEVWAGIPIESNYLLDTTIDLVLGSLGGVVGYYVGQALGTL